MKRSSLAICAHLSILAGVLITATIAQAAPKASNTQRVRLDVYTGVVDAAQLDEITALGIDRHELKIGRTGSAAAKQARGDAALRADRPPDALLDDGTPWFETDSLWARTGFGPSSRIWLSASGAVSCARSEARPYSPAPPM